MFIFSKTAFSQSFSNPFRDSLCTKYALTFCIRKSSVFDSFYNNLKTWICFFLDNNMLRRKLQSSGCSLVDNMSFLSGCFCRIYYLSVMGNRFLLLKCRYTFIFPVCDSVCRLDHRTHVLSRPTKCLPISPFILPLSQSFCSIFVKHSLQVCWNFLL